MKRASADAADTLAAPSRSRGGSLASGVLLMLVLTVVQRGVGFLRAIVFCRWLDVDEIGQWDLAFNFLAFAAPLAVLGLPGSFGRYVDHFRERGQLRTFLRRVTLLSAALAATAVTLLIWNREACGQLVFDTLDRPGLVLGVLGTLAAVICYNFLLSLFTALRHYRGVSMMQFAQTLLFAALGAGAVFVSPRSESVVAAFGLASCVVSVGAAFLLRSLWRDMPAARAPLPQRDIWTRLAPFAFWLWVTNNVCNAFDIVDRYLIMHHGGFTHEQAVTLVGQYHSARIFPLLLIGVAELLSTMLTPHLSSDWERGCRAAVAERLNSALKLSALGFTAASIAILSLKPLLFDWAFGGKYAAGAELLGFTLAAACWTALATIAYNYLWCAEKSRWVSGSLAIGLVTSMALIVTLLPGWQLAGLGWATCGGRGVVLLSVLLLNSRFGMAIDRRLLPLLLLPALLPWSAPLTAAVMLALVVGLGPLKSCFTSAEWAQWRTALQALVRRAQPYLPRGWTQNFGNALTSTPE